LFSLKSARRFRGQFRKAFRGCNLIPQGSKLECFVTLTLVQYLRSWLDVVLAP
jgi:hypothetical protein